jgi:hypothetical protein
LENIEYRLGDPQPDLTGGPRWRSLDATVSNDFSSLENLSELVTMFGRGG